MGPDPGSLSSDGPDLAALASGQLGRWRGLEPLPTGPQVADQLGAALDPTLHSGIFGGSPTMFGRYRPSDEGPIVVVWFEDDVAVGVEIERPVAGRDDIGAPDLVLPSAVGDRWEQYVYGSIGLVLHVPKGRPDGPPQLLLGLPPFDAERFTSDSLRHAGRRSRRERR